MAQKTFLDGDVLTASDINTYLMGEGGAWTGFTTTVTQVGTPTFTTTYSNYARHGRMITWNFALALTGAGTAGTKVTVTLPVAAASTAALGGAGYIVDATVGSYAGFWRGASTTTVQLDGDWSSNFGWGALPNVALASGDTIYGSITYEAAS